MLGAMKILLPLLVLLPLRAVALPADVTGDGAANISDVQCLVLTVLSGLDPTAPGLPACLAGPPSSADMNCNGELNVVDIVAAIKMVLGDPFPVATDFDQDGWLDACDPDDDGDGDPDLTDCAPLDPARFHGAPEVCGNAVDEDCDGVAKQPACGGKACGDDGCGGSCGSCPPGAPCISGACQSSCPTMAAPDPVVDPPLPSMTPAGLAQTTTGTFTDDWLTDGTGLVKIATRRQWGATIVFFGLASGAGTNTIDANDTGREVQVAFYDPARIMQGCAWNASCQSNPGAACPGSITYLGWNPVQGGNECNIGSGVEWVTAEPGLLRASVRPLFWNPDWQSQTCDNGGCGDPAKKAMVSDVRYTQTLRFVDPLVAELEMRVDNLAAVAHASTAQEFPTLYASYGAGGTQDLRDLMDAAGNLVPIDIPANDGFFYRQFVSPGPFVALQNPTHDYGVGIYYENRLAEFQGWQKKGVFNNVRAVFPFGIPANGSVVGRAYLILGSFGTIAAKAAWLDGALGPFGAVDGPAADATVAAAGALPVSGWALDNLAVAHIELRVDGVVAKTVAVTQPRADVCLVHPGYSACPTAGFSTTLPVSTLSHCAHLLEVRAVDSHGNARVLGKRRFFVGAPPPCIDDAACEDGDPCTKDVCGATGCTHAPVPSGSGPAETCNGADDDCDGLTDEGDVCSPTTHGVYRYYRSQAGETDHMFGLSPSPPAGYAFEGKQFDLFNDSGAGLVPLWQLWCASCTNHLQSTSATEGAPSYGGAELLGWCAAQASPTASRPLRRLYSAAASDHFASASEAEWAAAQALGYVLEGVLCYVP